MRGTQETFPQQWLVHRCSLWTPQPSLVLECPWHPRSPWSAKPGLRGPGRLVTKPINRSMLLHRTPKPSPTTQPGLAGPACHPVTGRPEASPRPAPPAPPPPWSGSLHRPGGPRSPACAPGLCASTAPSLPCEAGEGCPFMPERQLTWPTSPHLGPRPQPPTRRFAPEPRRLQSRRPSTSLRTAVLGWASVSLVRAGSVSPAPCWSF